jgi:hypothetical protein
VPQAVSDMSTIAVVGLATILILWFAVSVIGQFNWRITRWLRGHDHFSLVPRWTFFAPRPGRTDYHLMFQIFHADDTLPWREHPLADRRTLLGAVWNPQKRNKKALADLVRSMTRATAGMKPDTLWRIQFTVPYLALLSYLSGLAAAEGASHVRFMILESEGFYWEREPWPVFLSARHHVA